MPGNDLVVPAAQGPSELAKLRGHVRIDQVVGELAQVDAGGVRGFVVEPSEGLFGVPDHADLAFRVTGLEEPEQLRFALVIETLMALGEQPAGPVERVIAVASVTEGVVLHTPADVIEAGVGELITWNGSATWTASVASTDLSEIRAPSWATKMR